MSIFKDKKYFDPEKIKKNELFLKIYNLLNRIFLICGLFLNGIMMVMMAIRYSPLFFLFLINTYFLLMGWKGRKLKLP